MPKVDLKGKPLTPRQTEVMELITAGKDNVTIGTILGMSTTTVKRHLHYCYRKLDAFGRVLAAVRYDRQKRVIRSEDET